MTHSIGEVATLAGVSVRTLHYYDEIGLIEPSGRSDAGYRLYDQRDLERLQQVLVYRELGFELDTIRELVTDPDFDPVAALREQRRLLGIEDQRMHAMLDAVETAIDAHERGITMDEKDMFEVFGDFDPKEHDEETRERWGGSDAYKQSANRTSRYTKSDWIEIKAEEAAIGERFAAAMADGQPADGERAMDVAEAHRHHIDQRYYTCLPHMHVGLAEMYVADQRFAAHWDQYRNALAPFVRDAIVANAERAAQG